MMTWIVFASGGPVDSPWDKELEVQAHDIAAALEQAETQGLDPVNIDGIISKTLNDDLGLDLEPEGEETENE